LKTIRSVKEMAEWSARSVRRDGTCGLVPTLGGLHDGHRSLIKKARRENRRVVVSTFVNPYQFRKRQYANYPRNHAEDARIVAEEKADVLFAPSAEEMYPTGRSITIKPAMMDRVKRQNINWHYRAVLVVVMKLFSIVRPDRAYFGMKDPYQLALIQNMVEELNVPVEVRTCKTVRERGGLAFSSRNALLSAEEKKSARVIYRALKAGRDELLKKGVSSAGRAAEIVRSVISAEEGVLPEHVEVVDAETLLPLGPASREALLYASARVEGQRLTDNVRFRIKKGR